MFRKMLSLDEARQTIAKQFSAEPLGVEETPLLQSDGRILAEDVIADMDIPPFDRSTVDGYAVRAEDTFGAEENKPARLIVSGTVSIGKLPKTTVKNGEAAEIVTGAPIPEGADSVVMMEYTSRKTEMVTIFSAVGKGENIMKAGADIKKHQKILSKGQLLGSREIGVLAAIGKAKIKVYTIPTVAVLSTGPELTEPGKRLHPGKIYDTNGYALTAAIMESGGKPSYLGLCPDNAEKLRAALIRALDSSDIIVTSGAVSVGPKDIMPKTLDTLGKPGVIISGIAIKPGKPVTVASISGKPVFSLPGHPASALLTFQLFVHPLIQNMGGRKTHKPAEVKAYASMRMFPAKGRRTFVTVKLKRESQKRLIAEPVPTAQSGAITMLAKADGFLEIPEDLQFIDAGELVIVKLFKEDAFL